MLYLHLPHGANALSKPQARPSCQPPGTHLFTLSPYHGVTGSFTPLPSLRLSLALLKVEAAEQSPSDEPTNTYSLLLK